MRTHDEVLERFREMRARKLRESKDKLLSKGYVNCIHNVRLKVIKVGLVGLCQNPDILKKRTIPLVCNDDVCSGRCSCFECRNTESSVEREFDDVLHSPARCGEEYPKLAMLIWFLQNEDGGNQTWFSKLSGHLSRLCAEFVKIIMFRWLT